MSILLLGSEGSRKKITALSQALSHLGVQCHTSFPLLPEETRPWYASRVSREANGLLVFLDNKSPSLYYELGRAIEKRLPVLVVSSSHTDLPRRGEGITWLPDSLETSALANSILQKLQHPAHNRVITSSMDPLALASWLQESPERIYSLSSSQFELIVGLLLKHMNMDLSSERSPGGEVRLGVHSESGMRVLIQVKHHDTSQRLGVGELSNCLHDTRRRNAHAAFLFCSAPLTQSARTFAAHCVPPVHCFDRSAVMSRIAISLSDKSDSEKSSLRSL